MSAMTKTAGVLTVLDEIQPAGQQDFFDACIRALESTEHSVAWIIRQHVRSGRIVRKGRGKASIYSLPRTERVDSAATAGSSPKLSSDQLLERTRPSASEADELRAALAEEILSFMAEAETVPNDGAGWSAGAIASELGQETRQVALAIAGLVKASKLLRHTAPSGFYAYCLPVRTTAQDAVTPRITPRITHHVAPLGELAQAGQAVSVQADQIGEQPPQRGPGVDTSRPVTAQPSTDQPTPELSGKPVPVEDRSRLEDGWERKCRECGCTTLSACNPRCWWVAPDLCSSCDAAAGRDAIKTATGDALRSIGDFLQQDMARVDNFEASVRAGIEGSLRDVDDLLSEVLDAEAPHKVARCVLSAQISLRHALAAMPRMS